ncbi:ATP-dependent DNA ligase [Xylona heveae TC161]|uniref:DNA ligase n=1 Tax=Xylona heveae (strain CBS 132557 / TC161) TaxID=1328760 RepID=A0A165I8W4_XYLHT|nr:ATP-dependent DNA ligase [Xylona heveae TC161]KZF24558.1 ATP-dependent DNA ligase [Xylona heveae TC161]
MPSPSKRRKKNDYHSTPQTARSLDYFFSKQTQSIAQPEKATPRDGQNDLYQSDEPNFAKEHQESTLNDEELARKLQAEWEKEDTLAREAPADVVPAAQPTNDKSSDSGNHTPIQQETAVGRPCSNGPTKHTLSLQSAAAAEDTVSAAIPFDESPLTFDPSKYIPALQEHWASEGGDATYALLTRCFVLVNSTQSRIKIVDTLVNFLRTIIEGDPSSLLPSVWLATNSISPSYISLELGLGGSAISKALKKVCGLDNQGLKTLYNKYGDAGDVAFEAKKKQSFTLRKPKPLSIKSVYQSLVKIANSKGHGSQETKQRIVERLVQDARGAEESRYIVRTLVQHLRIGAVKTTMLIALSRAFLLSRPPGADFSVRSQSELAALKKDALAEIYARPEEIVKACFARRPNYNDLVPCLLEVGVSKELLLRCGLALHIPLRPMLGSITRDLGEMLTKLQGRDFSCEYKYDGQRAQVHCDERGKVTIFSRHLEIMTDKYPDLVALVPQIRSEGVDSFIMEGEVVAVDHTTGELKTFQTLANRARKDVVIGSVTIDVCLFAFDLMYLNGEELLDRPFRERRELLRSLFIEVPHKFTWVKSIDATSSDSESVREFFKGAVENKCEGMMVKVLDNLPNPELQHEIELAETVETANTAQLPNASDTKPKSKSSGTKSKSSKTKTSAPKILPLPALPTDLSPEKEQELVAKERLNPTTASRRKALLATYEPDKRLDSWLKVKKDYDSTAADTLDLIPVAGWHGNGRKAKWWSPILMAVRNPETGSLEAVCKCMSGFTDKFYQANKEKYPDIGTNELSSTTTLLSQPSYVEYTGADIPAIWFEPQEVWEMAFADITLSPTYTAAIGLVSQDRGLSLRFPRFLRVRDDKGIDDASTSDFLAGLWRKQEAKGGNNGNGNGREEGATGGDAMTKEEKEEEQEGGLGSGSEDEQGLYDG